MDQDNENEQEARLDTVESNLETQSSSVQDVLNLNDISSETGVTENLVDPVIDSDLKCVSDTEAKLSSEDCNAKILDSTSEVNEQTISSPISNDSVNVETDIKTSVTRQENETTGYNAASPLSSSSGETSQREISLGGPGEDEKFENSPECENNDGLQKGTDVSVPSCTEQVVTVQNPVDANESVKGDDVIEKESSPVPEGNDDNDGSEICQEDNDKQSLSPPAEQVHDSVDEGSNKEMKPQDSFSAVDDESVKGDDVIEKELSSVPEGKDDNEGSDIIQEDNVKQSLSLSAEHVQDSVEGSDKEMKPQDTFSAVDKEIESVNNNDGDSNDKDAKQEFSSSVIDTSMFPKPPREIKNSVVVANCFELDVTAKPVGVIDDTMDSATESNSAFPGPSDDREDISDEELDLECPSNVQQAQDSVGLNPIPSSISDHPSDSLNVESFVHKSDNISLHSSDVGDIIDLKLEDAALKSIGSSCEKVSNEDLEAVSDDELPNAPHVSDLIPNQGSTSLLDDREEVSSIEDEEMDKPQQNLDATPISSEDEFPSQAEEASILDSSGLLQQPDSRAGLESLEAEPISDEEDDQKIISDGSAKQETSFDDGEAGEIKSPALGSPISEQGDIMLGEVEPVSADESQDTDGELPSGDEAEKDKGDLDKKFESIDSDEEIPGDNQRSDGEGKVKSGHAKTGYMETISDEENLDGDDLDKKPKGSSQMRSEENQNPVEKGHIPTSFNEHQVELDYEEGYGEEASGDAKADTKEDESKVDSKPTTGEDEDEGLASDKDEGELSDDDCEEGEIKEPGQRKMFVKPICRFFQRGHCTWGISCRFLHPGVNDKGNYQMIEIPGFKPVGIHARLGTPAGGQYPEQQPPPEQEEAELPPPPVPDVPRAETAWERGLRIAKEQRKKASERKEKEPDFEEKRLNLSVEEDRELNKENERTPRIIPKDPYYDQNAYEVDEYYKIPRDPWHTGHYENFEVRYHHQQQENAYSPPYREKPPLAPPPPMRYTRPLSPPIDKFGRNREERPPPPERPREPIRVSDYPPPANKHPDEWIDPWRRSKSPKQRKPRSRSRGRKTRRSLSDSSDSSRSSRSSSGSSRSSRSGSSSSSSRSRSPEPAPPGVDRTDRHERYGGDQPRSMVSVRGPDGRSGGGYNNRYNNNNNNNNNNNDSFRYGRGNQGYSSHNNHRGGGGGRNQYNSRQDMYQGGRGGGPGAYNNNYRGYGGRGGGPGGGYNNNRDPRNRYGGGGRSPLSRGGRGPTPDRPLPYTRPRPKSRSSSRSSSSRSRSRSRSKSSDSSRSRSSSNSSRSSSSSSSSGSADSDHLYRDLGSPSKTGRQMPGQKKRPGMDSRGKDSSRNPKSNHHHPSSQSSSSRHPLPPSGMMPGHPRSPTHSRDRSSGGSAAVDPKYSQIPLPPSSSSSSAPSSGRSDNKYASRNAPPPPVKAKDPLKVMGQKPNIKLTLLPKQQQQSNLGDRPNPLASPPHKRRMSDRDLSPPSPPPNKRPALSMQSSSLRLAAEKAAKLQMRSDKNKSPPPGSMPPPPSSSASSSSSMSAQRSKNPMPSLNSPQKQSASKSRPSGESAAKAPSGVPAPPASNPAGAKAKKSMSSRREELLKQLKAVEDAIARKKYKMS